MTSDTDTAGHGTTPDTSSATQPGLLELAAGVIVDPSSTLRVITKDAPVRFAVILTLVISVLSSSASAAQMQASEAWGPFERLAVSRPALIIGMVLLGPIFSLTALAIGAGILKLSSLVLGGKSPYRSLFAGLAFANVPSVFGIPAQLLPLALGQAGQMASGMLNLALLVWIVFLAVIAVREANAFSIGRAVAAVLIPVGVVFVLFFALALVFVFAMVGEAGRGGL